jgi:hypothetical protein
MEERKGACRFLWVDLREGDHLENPSVDGGKWIFKKWVGGMYWGNMARDRRRL